MKDKYSLTMNLSEKELNLIKVIRTVKYGKIQVRMEDNQPVMLEEIRENIKL